MLSSILLSSSPYDVTRFVGDSTGLSYTVSTFIMKIVEWILGFVGLDHNQTLETFLYAAVVLGVSLLVGRALQWVVFHLVRLIARHRGKHLYDTLTQQNFFRKACRVIPPIVFLILIEFTLTAHNDLSTWFTRLALIYMVLVIAVAITALIRAVWHHVDARDNKRKLPLKGIAQLIIGIVWIISVIVVIGILVDKSPGALLAGLGAFAAVLMLVFKDSILGLVAGVQLSENDSLHVGDWIAVQGTNANGTVLDLSLTAVKVLNWDKTTTTLPPYSLISSGFTNYRSMQESNTRRICRSFMIDADSVLPATPEMLENIRKVPFMDEYITKKLEQRAAGRVADVNNPDGLVNGTIDTNLGLFRAYFKMWLDASPLVAHDSDCFVSTLPQTASGIPFQVYCFTNTSKWFPYEAIQDTIFEQLASMLRAFQLYTFENPSGRDTVMEGYLSPGGDIDQLYGVPYPFFQNPGAPDSPASTRVGAKQYYPSAASPYAAKPAQAAPSQPQAPTQASAPAQRPDEA